MKKKILFLFICAVLLLTSQVFAESISLTGKKVAGESEVTLNGVKIKNAIIVDDSSFAPLRDIAEALNVDLAFEKNEKGAVIKLETPEQIIITNESIWEKASVQTKINMAHLEIERANQTIDYCNEQLAKYTHEVSRSQFEKLILEHQDIIIQAQQDIITYTNELLELESAN